MVRWWRSQEWGRDTGPGLDVTADSQVRIGGVGGPRNEIRGEEAKKQIIPSKPRGVGRSDARWRRDPRGWRWGGTMAGTSGSWESGTWVFGGVLGGAPLEMGEDWTGGGECAL